MPHAPSLMPDHQIQPLTMNRATRTMLITASGRKIFQPSRMRMSYLSRGIVQRTQTKTNSSALTLTMNASADSRNPRNVAGSWSQGMSHPPRKNVVMRADIVAMAMYSPMKKSANFIDEYSVWYPA